MNHRCSNCSDRAHAHKLPDPIFEDGEINNATGLCWKCDTDAMIEEVIDNDPVAEFEL